MAAGGDGGVKGMVGDTEARVPVSGDVPVERERGWLRSKAEKQESVGGGPPAQVERLALDSRHTASIEG